MPEYIVQIAYFVSALLCVFGLQKISSVKTNKYGGVWILGGIVLATITTLFHSQVGNHLILILGSIVIGGGLVVFISKVMTLENPRKMTAFFGALGALSIALIMFLQLLNIGEISESVSVFAMLSMAVASITFTGYLTVCAKVQGIVSKKITFPLQHWLNALILVITLTFGVAIILNGEQFELSSLLIFFCLALLLGVLFILPSQLVDISMIVSLLNALTGLALGLAACIFANWPMLIAGGLVASAALVMTWLTSTLNNRSLSNALLSENESASDEYDFDGIINESTGTVKNTNSADVATMMSLAKEVIIVPGYGMALSQAQDSLWELTKLLKSKEVDVKIALHPMAGRMTGHMNALLADTGINYESLFDLDDINQEFENADVVLLVGANDIVNPRARNDEDYSMFGVSILNADQANNVIVIKRGEGLGFTESENPLFNLSNTSMLFGDADEVLTNLVRDIKAG